MLTQPLDLDHWRKAGTLLVEDFLIPDQLRQVQEWVNDLEIQPATPGGLLQYDEVTDEGRTVRCRTENIAACHAGMRDLLTRGPVIDIAATLLGEPAVLYKEKINYKQPGGAGFAPHQDAPAYPFVRGTITCMLAVDEATPDNGCLELVEGMHQEPLPTDEAGCIPAGYAAALDWQPMPARAGSLLWFGWYVPHRSGPNTTPNPRRAIYLTYNAASDGDHREAYYREKQQRMTGGDDRISLIGHFIGRTRPAGGQHDR